LRFVLHTAKGFDIYQLYQKIQTDRGMGRKLTAIVAADIAGYSLLLGQNETALLAALTRFRRDLLDPSIRAYGGRVFRLLGDGSLFSFDSALHAVEFAVSIQGAMVEWQAQLIPGALLQFRMGVALGDVVSDGEDIHGDGVNIAARLEALAPPGGICVSRAVFDQIKPPLNRRFEPLGARQLKNIASPVEIWRFQPLASAQLEAAGVSRLTFNGRQILDPKVSNLIVDLHMRSALLAASDAFDEILMEPDEGRSLPLAALYSRIGDKINRARHMLSCIGIQSEVDLNQLGHWQPESIMSEYISNVFDDAATAFAMRLLPQIQAVLQSDQPAAAKRIQLMNAIRGIADNEMTAKAKKHIKFAFVDV
jgi:class 3 adenylate cyclase